MYTTFEFVDSAGGITLYQMVNIADVLWLDGAPGEASGGAGVIMTYPR